MVELDLVPDPKIWGPEAVLIPEVVKNPDPPKLPDPPKPPT